MKIKINGKEIMEPSLLDDVKFLDGITYLCGGVALPIIMATVPSIVNLALISKFTAIVYLGTLVTAPVILIVSGSLIVSKVIVDRYLL